MEIEKKYLVKHLPENLETYPHKELVQSYISRSPVIRIRHSKSPEEEKYVLTIKGGGLAIRQEYELLISREEYESLRKKEEGKVLEKTRYKIPLNTPSLYGKKLVAELDLFHGHLEGLYLVEVEFETVAEMNAFNPPEWFGEDVSGTNQYHNSTLSL
ncbi:MAG: CYTH domain-containing protein [Firmicutes bacterium]|nr:CYTH domain-containing protein [Bacillota bacterium]